MEDDGILLNSYEITAYWWINMIKKRVKELYLKGCYSKREEEFLNIFKKLSLEDYRNIYQELVTFIYQDVANQQKNEKNLMYFQDTKIRDHGRLNTELSLIMNLNIPDINIHTRDLYNYRIYTNFDVVYQDYDYSNLEKIENVYDDDYILTGNEELLNLYKCMTLTIKKLTMNNDKINTFLLIKLFSQEYLRYNNLNIDLSMMKKMCIKMLNRLNDLEIIKGRSYSESIKKGDAMDLALLGIDGYKKASNHYANYILDNEEKVLKKIK